MDFEKELDIYLRARFTLMLLVTPEEERALQTVKVVCENARRPCLSWDMADGFQLVTGNVDSPPSARDPLTALEHVDKVEDDTLFVFKDFHECWDSSQIKRKLRSLAQRLRFTKKSILVTSPSSEIPDRMLLYRVSSMRSANRASPSSISMRQFHMNDPIAAQVSA